MLHDEVRVRHSLLIVETPRERHREEWAEIEKLRRLSRKVRLAQARLGLRVAPEG